MYDSLVGSPEADLWRPRAVVWGGHLHSGGVVLLIKVGTFVALGRHLRGGGKHTGLDVVV